MSRTLINPAGLFDGEAFGMSQAVTDEATGLVFISGQVDWDERHAVKSDDVPEQLRGALDNLDEILSASGCRRSDVLSLRVLIRGEFGEHIADAAPILVERFGDVRPAMTGIGVASLASPDTLVEVEAVARRPRG